MPPATDPTRAGPGARPSRPLALLLLLVLAAWSGAVARGGFAYDDREAILGNPVVEGTLPWTAAFQRDYWHHRGDAGHFRPTASLSLRLDRALWGEDPAGYHATGVLLHLAVVLLAALSAALLLPAGRLPWLGLGFFALHPALADSVAWISGRTSLLAALGGLAGAWALLGALRGGGQLSSARLLGAALASAGGLLLGLLGKEDALVFAPVYLLLALRRGRRASLACLLGVCAGLLAYGWLRAGAMGSPFPAAPGAPLAGEPLVDQLRVAGRALLEGFRLIAWPAGHPPSYRSAPWLDPGGASALLQIAGWVLLGVLVTACALALLRGRRSLAAWAGLLAAASVVPVLQLVPSGEVFAPRFLYLPLLLAAPLTDAALRRALGAPRRPAAALLACLAVVLAWQRAGVYSSRGAYCRAVLRWIPEDVHSWNDLGLHLEEVGDLDGARARWERAIELRPDYSRPWSNLGRLELADGDLEAAERALRRAAELGPRNPRAHCNLGSLLLRRVQLVEAAREYFIAASLAPGMVEAWRGLAQALWRLERRTEARQALDRALELDPGDRLARELARRWARGES